MKTQASPRPVIRRSRQREAILQELRGRRDHPTAVELHIAMRRLLPHLSLGTVYRNLELLAHQGQVLRLEFGSAQSRFDGCSEPHLHVRCKACGKVEDVTGDLPTFPFPAGTQVNGYRITQVRVELVGLCPYCTTSEPAGSAGPELVDE